MKFAAYDSLAATPNIIVDGSGTPATVLTLSHWPKSGSPGELRADTSTEIVFNYLDRPSLHLDVDAVSNNHFDEDGLVGIFALTEPTLALAHRELLIDVAQAGDFGFFTRRAAARIAFVVAACGDAETSPFPKEVFALPYGEQSSEMYVRLLDLLPRLITNVNDYRALWDAEDARLEASEQLIADGAVTITERPEFDLAIVRLPSDLASRPTRRTPPEPLSEIHPYALHNQTTCTRILTLRERWAEFRYRYEGWVQLASRRPPARVDLTSLAAELTLLERGNGRWTFDGVEKILPALRLRDAEHTSLHTDDILRRLEEHLQRGAPAWNPYD